MTGSTESTEGTLRAGILAIGDEVLDGLVLDTNSNWIETRLAPLGVEMNRLVSVRDNLTEIGRALKFLMETCNLVITSGGLGPTHDDMTLKAVAQAFNRNLVEDQKALNMVEKQYRNLHDRGIVDNSEITESRRKMARIPEGSAALNNSVGGAPGVMLEIDNITIFCLPGVPSELKMIFDGSIVPWIQKKGTTEFYERIIEFEMRDESVFSPIIDAVMKMHPGVYIKSMPRTYGTSHVLKVWVSSRGSDKDTVTKIVDDAIRSICHETGLEAKSGK
ncbi:MAG: molybdopterin-binding protein [Candidatus Thorarchaeota archaeon]